MTKAFDMSAEFKESGLVPKLARPFEETIQARMKRDPAFRDALLAEAADCFIAGEITVVKAILRDLIQPAIAAPPTGDPTPT